MPWNWELPDWPAFTYDLKRLAQLERQFLMETGSAFGYLKTIDQQERNQLIVEILSMEGLESSRIEGEILDRESLQSSIRQHFGLQPSFQKRESDKEIGMARLLCSVYESFDQPLTHEMLWQWHAMLFTHKHLSETRQYRIHAEPMQIVSSRYDVSTVFFEAPPSDKVFHEMTRFIDWFNQTQPSDSILGRAAVAHVYFENIHPFEDGNGRVGRVLVEKILSQAVGRPLLIAVSRILEKRKKQYYSGLEKCNRTLAVQEWVEFFAQAIMEAQKESLNLLYFLIEKSKMFNRLSAEINPRQTKVLLKMFAEGPSGFKGGLSAENYIAMTKTTRSTATRDLADLVEKGALIKTGELRHTRYRLNLVKSDLR